MQPPMNQRAQQVLARQLQSVQEEQQHHGCVGKNVDVVRHVAGRREQRGQCQRRQQRGDQRIRQETVHSRGVALWPALRCCALRARMLSSSTSTEKPIAQYM